MANTRYFFADGLIYDTTLTDSFTVVSSTASYDASTLSVRSVKFAMTSGNQNAYVSTGHNTNNYASIRKTSVHSRIRISGTPAGNFIFFDWFGNGAAGCWIDTSRKLNIGVSATHLTTSTNTITAGTEYILESIWDLDVGSFGTMKAKLMQSDGTLVEEITYTLVSGDTTPTYNPFFGMNNIKSANNPAINVWMGQNICQWEAGSNTISYIGGNSAWIQSVGAPSAESSYTDFTALSGTKVNSVSENPSDGDTSYIYKWLTGGPTAAPTLAAGAAGNLNGSYKYRVTNITSFGESSYVDSTTASQSVTNQKIELSNIQTNISPDVTSRKLYRTLAGGSTYYYLATIADNTTTTYSDNTADGGLDTSKQAPANGSAFASPSQEDFIFSGSGLTSPTDYALGLGNTSNWVSYSATNYGYAANPADDSAIDLTKISFGFKAVDLAGQLDISMQYKVSQVFAVKVTANSDGTGAVLGVCFLTNFKLGVSSSTAPASLLIRFSGGGTTSDETKVFLTSNPFMFPM